MVLVRVQNVQLYVSIVDIRSIVYFQCFVLFVCMCACVCESL